MKLIIKKSLPVIILLFAVVTAIVINQREEEAFEPEEQEKPVVQTQPIEFNSVQLKLDSYATVESIEHVELALDISGRVLDVSDVFEVGNFVKKNQVLATIDAEEYRLKVAQAKADLAQAKYELTQQLAKSHVAKMQWKDFESATDLALNRPQLAYRQAAFQAKKAALSQAQRNLEKTKFRAPFDGLITEKKLATGQLVSQGKALGKLASTKTAVVRLPIAYEKLSKLSDGENNVVLFDALNHQWQGKIVRHEQVLNKKNRMTYLVAHVDDPYQLMSKKAKQPLRFGTFVHADIFGKTITKAIQIPTYVIHDNQVALLNDKHRIELRAVNVVHEMNEQAIIIDGLQAGEQVITSLVERRQLDVVYQTVEEKNKARLISTKQSSTSNTSQVMK